MFFFLIDATSTKNDLEENSKQGNDYVKNLANEPYYRSTTDIKLSG